MKHWILSALFLMSCSTAFSSELSDRAHIKLVVAKSFFSADFAQLENMAKEFRDNQTRTSSGLWKLTFFYRASSVVSDRDTDDHEYWERVYQIADSWVSKYPESPTPQIFRALVALEHAWAFRGSGYAHTVKPENWKPFREKIAEAKKILLDNKKLADVDPHWYVAMATVARAEGWPKPSFVLLIDEALRKEPLYYQTYFAAINYFSPNWHGDSQHVEEFAKSALEYTKDKEGMGMYTRIYWAASQSHYGTALFTRSTAVWEKMRAGVDDILDRYPDQWNINNFAMFACLAGDKDTTLRLIGMIEGKPILSAWGDARRYQACRRWAFEGVAQR